LVNRPYNTTFYYQGHCRASGINRSKNARLARLSIPFSAGALAVQAGLIGVRMPAWQGFLSLFQQGKDLKHLNKTIIVKKTML